MDRRGGCSVLVGKPELRRQFGRPSCRWEDYIKMILKSIRWERAGWIIVVQDRDKWQAVVTMVMNILGPYNKLNFLTG